MLENTLELANLLPAEMRQDLIDYINEINLMLDGFADEHESQRADVLRPRVELIFFLKYLYIRLSQHENHYNELMHFFHHLGLGGFRYENNVYGIDLSGNQQETGAGQEFVDFSVRLTRELDVIIQRFHLELYIYEFDSDNELLRMLFREDG